MATGDLIITDNKLAVGTTENLSTLTVRATPSFTLTGTLASTENSATVTGTGTRFLSELAAGDRITMGDGVNIDMAVIAIASDTSLTVGTAYDVTQSGQTADALPSTARFDDSTGAAQVVVNDAGNVGIGTMSPNAALDVSGTGAGWWRGCDVSLRVHTPEFSDAWQIVMSTDAGGPDAGVAMWLNDHGDGTSQLVFTMIDAADNELDALGLDGTGITLQGGLVVNPVFVNAAYTLGASDYYLCVDGGATGTTVTLPVQSASMGKVFYIHKLQGAGDVTIAPAGTDKINGVNASKTITTQFDGIKLVAMSDTWVATLMPAA